MKLGNELIVISKAGRPRKNAHIDKEYLITNEVKEALNNIKARELIQNSEPLKDFIWYEVQKRTAEAVKSYAVDRVLILGLMQGILHPRIIKKINRVPGQPLRGFSSQQINIFIGCYIISKLKNNIFTYRNLLTFAPTYYNTFKICNDLRPIIEAGYLEKLTNEDIYRRTGKLPKIKPRSGKLPHYIGITRAGVDILQQYFDLFDKHYKKLNEGFLSDEIEYLTKI